LITAESAGKDAGTAPNPSSSRQPGHSSSVPTPVNTAPHFPQTRLLIMDELTVQTSVSPIPMTTPTKGYT
jgi:hypothetical protein